MYEPGTTLKRKEPKSTKDKPWPYDELRVIGQSPVNHSGLSGGEWVGSNGQGVIVQPLTEFGAVTDQPYGRLLEEYEVTHIPEHEAPVQMPVRVVNAQSGAAGKSPEEVFAEGSKGTKSEKRVPTPRPNPLDTEPA